MIKATQAEAQAGTDNTKFMTPLRTAEAIAALGGGGGANIVRGSGTLEGYEVAGSPATSPPTLEYAFQSPGHSSGWVDIDANGSGALAIYFSDTDPAQTYWINTSAMTTSSELAAALVAVIDSIVGPGWASVTGGGSDVVAVNNPGTGVASTISGATSFTDCTSVSGGGAGTDEVLMSGHVSEVTLIAVDGTKTIKPLKAGISGAGVNSTVQLALKESGNYHPIGDFVPTLTTGEIAIGETYVEWLTGRASAALVARMTGAVPDGGSITCWAIAEQA